MLYIGEMPCLMAHLAFKLLIALSITYIASSHKAFAQVITTESADILGVKNTTFAIRPTPIFREPAECYPLCSTIKVICVGGRPGSGGSMDNRRCELTLPKESCDVILFDQTGAPIPQQPAPILTPDELAGMAENIPVDSFSDATSKCALEHELVHAKQAPCRMTDCLAEAVAYSTSINCLAGLVIEKCTDQDFSAANFRPAYYCGDLNLEMCGQMGAHSMQACRVSPPSSCKKCGDCIDNCKTTVKNCLAAQGIGSDNDEQRAENACNGLKCLYCPEECVTPTPTSTPTSTPTESPTATPTATETPEPTATPGPITQNPPCGSQCVGMNTAISGSQGSYIIDSKNPRRSLVVAIPTL